MVVYKCRIYIRVSTKSQADKVKGSPKDQLKLCREIIKDKGWIEASEEPFSDTDSGQSIEPRIGLNKALEEAKRGTYNLLVIYDFDRLARAPGDCVNLATRDFINLGVQIYSKSQAAELDPPDKINRYSDSRLINVIFSAYKSGADINKMRAKYDTGMLNKVVRNGELPHPKSPPYGYRSNIKGASGQRLEWVVKIYEPEAKIVRRIFNRYLLGHSFRKIARDLTDDIIPTPGKKKWWNYSTIQLILENPVYAGKVRWQWKKSLAPKKQTKQPKNKWILVDGKKHKKIIEFSQFKAVQALMARKKKLPGRSPQGKSLLSGILKCANCNKNMYSMSATKNAPAHYNCATWHQFRKCESNYLNMEKMDRFVTTWFATGVSSQEFSDHFLNQAYSKKGSDADPILLHQKIIDDLTKQKERTKLNLRKGKLAPKYANDILADIDRDLEPELKAIRQIEEDNKNKLTIEEYQQIQKDVMIIMSDAEEYSESHKSEFRTLLLKTVEKFDVRQTKGDEILFRFLLLGQTKPSTYESVALKKVPSVYDYRGRYY